MAILQTCTVVEIYSADAHGYSHVVSMHRDATSTTPSEHVATAANNERFTELRRHYSDWKQCKESELYTLCVRTLCHTWNRHVAALYINATGTRCLPCWLTGVWGLSSASEYYLAVVIICVVLSYCIMCCIIVTR